MKKAIFFIPVIILSLLVNPAIFGQRKSIVKQPPQTSSKDSVTFSNIQAQTLGKGVLVQWQTDSETKNLGFMVYRVTAKGRELASKYIIPGSYMKMRVADSTGGSYSYFDQAGDSSSQYEIESLSDSGQKQLAASVSAETVTAFSPNAEQLVYATNAASPSAPSATIDTNSLPTGTSGTVVGTQTDINVQRTLAATTGVKIGVKKEGFYRVTRAQLQAAGFNLTGSVDNWQLYLNGIQQSIVVDPSGNYLEFYGKGLDNLQTDTRVYFLIAGSSAGKRIASTVSRPLNAQVASNSYAQTFERKERVTYVSGLLNGDTQNYFGLPITTLETSDTFTLTGVDTSAANVVFEINMQGLTTTPHQIDLKLNDHPLTSITGNNLEYMTGRLTIPVSYLIEGSNTLKISEPQSGFSLIDSIRISYNRKYLAQQNQLIANTQNYKIAKVDGFSSANVRAFDLSDTANPVQQSNLKVIQNGATYSVNLPSSRAKTLLTVEDSGLLTAASVTANAPSTLSTTAHNATFLVISHSNFMTQANNWAAYRQSQGISTEVVNVEDVYDEFNYGVVDADPIRSFLQYAKNNWQTPPQYVLLVGDADFDTRNYEGKGNFNFVPTKFVDTVYIETGSDEALADFDNDGLAEIPIGRIPARTAQNVTDVLTKTQNFEATVANAFGRGALFAADDPNGYDFAGVNVRLAAQLPPTIPVTIVNKFDANSQSTLLSQMNSGKYLVHYSGHGNASVWSSTSFFSSGNVPQLLNSNTKLSVFTMLTCLNGYFVDNQTNAYGPNSDSLSELLLKSTAGGAAAVWSSSGLTTPDVQEVMGTRYYSQIGAGNILRLGDLIKDAKTTIPGGRDVRLSWCLLGDPMLKMH